MISREYEALRANLKPGLAVASDDVMRVREKMEAIHPTALPPDVRAQRLELAGLDCAWVDVTRSEPTPDGEGAEGSDRSVLYVHGGAFVATGVEHYVPYCGGLARFIPARFLVHGYSLAPEARFPTPVRETMAVWEAMLASGIDPERTLFAGDSCGGGIALAALCALRDAGRPLPAGYFGLTPWFDLEQTGTSARKPLGVDPFVEPEWIRARGRDYVGPGGDVRDPLASPLHADLSGLPPLFLSAGGIDTTRDDAARLAARAGQAGVDVTLEINAEMIHGFHGLAALIPEGRAALARCGDFVRRIAPDHPS